MKICKISAIILIIFLTTISQNTLAYKQKDYPRIHHIQQKSHISKYKGKYVKYVPGIVTAVLMRKKRLFGFYMQDFKPDNDPATSEGIFVFTRYAKVKLGDFVKVTGKVSEYARKKGHLHLTQIMAKYVKVVAHNRKIPVSILLGPGGKNIPRVIDNDGLKKFNPKTDAIDFYESMEGMIVKIQNPVVVTPPKRFGREIFMIPGNGKGIKNRTSNGGVYITKNNYNANRILLSTELTKQWMGYLKTGDRFKGNVIGVLTYDDGMYKLLTMTKLPKRIRGRARRETSRFRASRRRLLIATYNVYNLSAVNKKQINGIAKDVVYGLKSPDIIALQEIQDNNGIKGGTNNRNTDASETFKGLINAIRKNRGPLYDYVDFTPDYPNSSGGIPGANIRVGFLFRKDRVRFTKKDISKKSVKIIKTKAGISLSSNPGRIEPGNPVFKQCRKPLVSEFIFGRQKIFIINLHLLARGGDSPLFGSIQPPQRRSERERYKQASVVADFVKNLLTKDRNANVVVLGDFNDFSFSRSIKIFEKSGLTNLINKLTPARAYTYIHRGNSQTIDQFLVSRAMLRRYRGIDVIHFNSDFPERRRNSDHDPIVGIFAF